MNSTAKNAQKHVVVLGTGGAGLTAAIAGHDAGARVSVFEKADKVGGTTAWSGGMIWIPNNHHEQALGIPDSRDEALTYLLSMSHGLITRELAEAFIDAGPLMVQYLEEQGPVQFRPIAEFPDYHAEFPGGKTEGGRSLDCPPYSFDELGAWAERVTPSPYYPDPRLAIFDTPLGQARPQAPDPADMARRSARNERGSGQALIGRLLRACLNRGIEPRTGCRALELRMHEGAVCGVRIATPEGNEEVAADAVILATGGFEWDEQLKRAFLRGPMTHPVSIDTNTGDGLRMAMRVGAMLGNMREAWWMPVAVVPTELVSTGAANYNAFGAAFHDQDVAAFDYANLPCWMIFDQGYVDRYGVSLAGTPPGERPPQWIARADTLRQLAERLDISADGLEATVVHWNAMVASGHDDDFQRGDAAHDRWWGDHTHRGSPAASLGPLDRGPYYAIEIKSGALGTKGGPQVDRNANVVDVDGRPIAGLYAAGNVMASPMGMTYGGAGGTIAPGMVFGFLAGRHAAGQPVF